MDQPVRYPRTLHLDGSGLGTTRSGRDRLAWKELVGRNVVIEEKMDGSETSVEFDADLEPVVRFRGNPLDLASRGGAERTFNGLKDWFAANAEAFFDVIGDRYRVYGEWLHTCHRVFYDALPCHFLEFDILDRQTGIFLDTPSRRALLEALPFVSSVHVLFEGVASPSAHPSSLVGPSRFKSRYWEDNARRAAEVSGQDPSAFLARIDPLDLAEGVYGKVEEEGRVTARFKWVRPDFVRAIVDGGTHWKDMPPIPNLLSPEAAHAPPARTPLPKGT